MCNLGGLKKLIIISNKRNHSVKKPFYAGEASDVGVKHTLFGPFTGASTYFLHLNFTLRLLRLA